MTDCERREHKAYARTWPPEARTLAWPSNRAYSTINEGLGKVLRYGAYAPEVLDRLRWFRDALGPALGEVICRAGGVDIR